MSIRDSTSLCPFLLLQAARHNQFRRYYNPFVTPFVNIFTLLHLPPFPSSFSFYKCHIIDSTLAQIKRHAPYSTIRPSRDRQTRHTHSHPPLHNLLPLRHHNRLALASCGSDIRSQHQRDGRLWSRSHARLSGRNFPTLPFPILYSDSVRAMMRMMPFY